MMDVNYYISSVKKLIQEFADTPKYFVDTYGCQQNESDSEILRGLCQSMGYSACSSPEEADLICINTCAVREHAEMRTLGNVGALSHLKKQKPDLIIILTGCMMSEEHMRNKIKMSFPYVTGTLDTNSHDRLPEMVYSYLNDRKRRYYYDEERDILGATEGLPRVRTNGVKAWLPIMKGCNNFCSYCIVPYVRGREQSRSADDVLRDARDILQAGHKEISLLGQNVNSYQGIDGGFPELLRRINDLSGDFRLRFMTSHPKDAGEELFKAMSECEKVTGNLHLPFQSGSDRILKEMNRKYTSSEYLGKIEMARHYMPDLAISSDVIVGFPGETEEDYRQTEDLVRKVDFVSLFTFIYSRRKGTKAALIPDDIPESVIKNRFQRLVAVQDEMSRNNHRKQVGKHLRVLFDGISREKDAITARTDDGRLVLVKAPAEWIGKFGNVTITDSTTWSLVGKLEEEVR